MARFVVLAIALLGLAGCADDPKPAICDGKHRRPANLYGSVLPNIPGPRTAAPPAPAPRPPPTAPAPGPQSSYDPRSSTPCGGRA